MSDATTADGSEPESAETRASEAAPERRRRRRWLRILYRRHRGPPLWVRVVTALVVLTLGGVIAFLSQTMPGQRIVVGEILNRARAELAGDLTVGGIRSQTLLTGLTLTDVRLDAEGGVPVLSADSVVIRYSILSLIAGNPRIRATTLHGLDLEIAPQPDGEALNVERILAEGDGSGNGSGGSSGPANPLGLGRVSVRGGSIVALTPTSRTEDADVVTADGTPLRRFSFTDVDLDLEETVLRRGGDVDFFARLASFSATVGVVEVPFAVRAAVGNLTLGSAGLRITDGAFRLPGSLMEGGLGLGPEEPGGPWRFTANLSADDWCDLEDIGWIDPRIPAGEFRGAAEVRTGDGIRLTLRDFRVRTESSDVVANGGVRFDDDGMTLSGMALAATRLSLAEVEPWTGRELPLDGDLSGQGTFSGTLDALSARGRLTFAPAGGSDPSTAEFAGRLLTGDDPGADSLVVRFDPIDYRLLSTWWPSLEVLGSGVGSLELDGRADGGIAVVADFTHFSDVEPTSRVSAQGTLRRGERGIWTVNARGELLPLALGFVSRFRPVEGLRGALVGPVTVEGTLSDLHFTGNLAAGEGRLVVDGSIDLEDVGAAYALDVDGQDVNLSYFSPRAPEALLTGRVVFEGSGLTLDSLSGAATVDMRDSRIGLIRFGSAAARVRAEDGMLMIDTVDVDISGARINGSGTVGLVASADGRASFGFTVDSLLSLRPMFMGDSILVRDGLSPLEEDLLRVRGIEPDTLPTEIEVRMAGAARGRAWVRGDIRDLAVELAFEGRGLAYRADQVDSATVILAASGLPDFTGNWTGSIRARGITWQGRFFEGADFDGVMARQRGEGTLSIQRRENERYFVTGSFAVDSLGGEVSLTDASLQIDDLSWLLEHPSRITWDSTSLSIDSLALERAGDDPARVTAAGTLARGGDSNFRLRMEGFHVEDATRILQWEDLDVSGHVDLDLTVQGPAESPSMNAQFAVVDPRYGSVRLAGLSGALDYRDRVSDFQVDGTDGRREVLSIAGTLPVDLALADVEQRQLELPMNVRVTADSIDAAIALAYLGSLEDVSGTVSADIVIEGTTREPQPRGTVRLADGGWTISALGVRHVGLQGELGVRPDRVVDVRLEAGGDGRSTVTGTLAFDSIANPALDLVVSMDRFQAVDRRDIEGMLSGAFTVTGSYRRPVAEGQLTVNQGTLFVEEFQRNASVVDLRDPMLFADGFAVDTTVFVTQPILASLRNPFLDNLSVDIDLSVPRDLWLRSSEMNVEIGGELILRYDRREGDLVMVGDLQALRGSYQVLGRTFEMETGTVSFLGQPGVNPTLNLEALSRIRRRQGDRLEVRANVTGTLVQPLVTLSTTEAGLSQPDLMSYLLFGVPGGELGIGSPGGAGLGQGIGTGLGTYLSGTLASQLGSAVAQGIGIDYLAISQGEVVGDADLATNFFNTAQLETGFYVGDDVFILLLIANPTEQQGVASPGVGVNFLRGVRVEFALTDEWFVEGYIEDRFLRAASNLMQAGLDGEQVVGVLTFVEWGYGSRDREN